MYNFKRQIPNNTNTQVSILTYTRGLGIHSKMCATQMNTSENPGLWAIQLSTLLLLSYSNVMFLLNVANSCFQDITRFTQRWFSSGYDSKLGIRLPVIDNDSLGRLGWFSSVYMNHKCYTCAQNRSQL